MSTDDTSIPGYYPGILFAWIVLLLFLLFITTDIDAYIAYVAYERDWRFIAWLFSRSYPEL